MFMFSLAISSLTASNLSHFMNLTFQIPMQYCTYSIRLYFHHQSHPQLGLFLLWLHLFILSWVISPLISSSILGTYRPGEFIFQCPIILPFHTVHGVLKSRILKWFAILFSSGPHFVRTLHHDPSVLDGSTWHGSEFYWVRQHCGPCEQFDEFSVIVVFILCALWWIRGFWEGWETLPDGLDLIFVILVNMCLGVFLLGFNPAWGSVLPGLGWLFPFPFREIFR